MKRLLFCLTALCALPALAQPVDGAAVFKAVCAACHGAAGEGTAGIAPALAGTLAGGEDGRRYVMQVLLGGLSGKIVSQGQAFVGAMPAQAALSDAELAAVANHLAGLNADASAPFGAAGFAELRAAGPVNHKQLRELRARLAR